MSGGRGWGLSGFACWTSEFEVWDLWKLVGSGLRWVRLGISRLEFVALAAVNPKAVNPKPLDRLDPKPSIPNPLTLRPLNCSRQPPNPKTLDP